jgi:hypothetical protein
MPKLKRDPVMASKPVAKTMQSSLWSPSRVRIPFGVIASIGDDLISARVTLSRLKVS